MRTLTIFFGFITILAATYSLTIDSFNNTIPGDDKDSNYDIHYVHLSHNNTNITSLHARPIVLHNNNMSLHALPISASSQNIMTIMNFVHYTLFTNNQTDFRPVTSATYLQPDHFNSISPISTLYNSSIVSPTNWNQFYLPPYSSLSTPIQQKHPFLGHDQNITLDQLTIPTLPFILPSPMTDFTTFLMDNITIIYPSLNKIHHDNITTVHPHSRVKRDITIDNPAVEAYPLTTAYVPRKNHYFNKIVPFKRISQQIHSLQFALKELDPDITETNYICSKVSQQNSFWQTSTEHPNKTLCNVQKLMET